MLQDFTLLEVIGVLAVMATLMAIIAPKVLDQIDRAAQECRGTKLTKRSAKAVELYPSWNHLPGRRTLQP